uniref:Uncharacterized protein n=1 Tax=viral metagenome TaxID=1070528 RepID=A0A6C0LGQ0_9ZZZZ
MLKIELTNFNKNLNYYSSSYLSLNKNIINIKN